MIVSSKVLGQLELDESYVYTFEHGIPGFENDKHYVIVQPNPELPFSYLQSVDHEEVALLLTDPFLFYTDYDFELNEQIQEELTIREREDVQVWVTVSSKGGPEDATINLLAPIILNTKSMIGRQVILHETPYRTKHPLLRQETGGVAHASAHAQEG